MDSTSRLERLGRQLPGYRSISTTTVQGRAAVLFGLPFLCSGAYILGIALGVIDFPPEQIHAPMWVIGAAGGMFANVGLGLVAHGLIGMRRTARLKALGRARPEEPWLADHMWQNGIVVSREGTSVLWQFVGLSVWLGILAALNWWAFSDAGIFVVKGFALFFDLIAVLIVGTVLRGATARWKYGRPFVELDALPIRPGASFRGWIVCKRDMSVFDQFTLSLRLVEERFEVRGFGKNRRHIVACYERALIEQVLTGADVEGDSLSFVFELPADAESNRLRERPATFWDLEVKAAAPGVDFRHRFLMPVYGPADDRAEARAA